MSGWISYIPSSGIGDSTISVTATTFTGSTDRQERLKVYEDRFYDLSGKTNLHQLYLQITAITVESVWYKDVDYFGGEATYLNCAISVYAHRSDGVIYRVYDGILLTNSELLVEENDSGERMECGELTINAYYGGVSASTTVTAYQEGNPKYDYLTFEIVTGGTIVYKWYESYHYNRPLYYSINNGEWTLCQESTPSSSFTVYSGDVVRWKGTNTDYWQHGFGASTAVFDVYGNAGSIYYGDNFVTQGRILPSKSYTFSHFFSNYDEYTHGECANIRNCEYLYVDCSDCAYMFAGCPLTLAPKYLPNTGADTLGCSCMYYNCTRMTNGGKKMNLASGGSGGFRQMFQGCTGMSVSFDELPATVIPEKGYYQMYEGCYSLEKAPKILATEIGKEGCAYMFEGCGNLREAPELPIVKLGSTNEYGTYIPARGCYAFMFANCSGLTKAPTILPATELVSACYSNMFKNCISLNKAPIIKATSLEDSCCRNMFAGCYNLTETPFLWSETPSESAYTGMFSGCSRVDEVNCMVRITGQSNRSCIYGMLDGVKSTGKLKTNIKCYNGEHGWQSISVGTHYKAPSGWTETIVELF